MVKDSDWRSSERRRGAAQKRGKDTGLLRPPIRQILERGQRRGATLLITDFRQFIGLMADGHNSVFMRRAELVGQREEPDKSPAFQQLNGLRRHSRADFVFVVFAGDNGVIGSCPNGSEVTEVAGIRSACTTERVIPILAPVHQAQVAQIQIGKRNRLQQCLAKEVFGSDVATRAWQIAQRTLEKSC